MTQHAFYLYPPAVVQKMEQEDTLRREYQLGGYYNKTDDDDDDDDKQKQLGQRNEKRKRQMEEIMKDRIKMTQTVKMEGRRGKKKCQLAMVPRDLTWVTRWTMRPLTKTGAFQEDYHNNPCFSSQILQPLFWGCIVFKAPRGHWERKAGSMLFDIPSHLHNCTYKATILSSARLPRKYPPTFEYANNRLIKL